MMSKEKRRVPKLRFPGFTEDWEQCKLGEIFEYLQNNTLSRDSLNYKIPNIKNIHYGDILVKFNEILDGSNKDIPYINPDLDLSKFSKSLLRDGDVIFSDTAEDDTVGKAIELQNVNAPFILSGLHTIPCRPLIPFGKGYLGNFFNSNSYRLQIRPLVQGIKVSSISKSALKDTMIKYPKNLDEQEKIGSLFQSITKMITLHQRKLEHLNLKKKALLQKLFPKNGERYPELRFPGFTDAWEQRKLGDIATFSKGNGYSKSDLASSGDPIILYGRLYTNYETTISNVDTFVELKDKSVISQGGEVIVPASGETAEDISRASVVKNQGIIIGGDLNVIKANHLLDPTFLALTISNGGQQKELSKRAQGKSVVHLHNSDLQEVNLIFPLLNEQKEISTLFEKMDNIITLHQRKLDHLQLQKKALLQQMFV